MLIRTAVFIALLAGACTGKTADAKGVTVQITVTGPGLEAPLHLSGAAVTAANVWAGNFADWEAGAIQSDATDAPEYLLYFWVRFAPDDVQMKYVLSYRWDADADRAIVCLPGPQNIWYRTNVYSIVRKGKDGKCFYTEKRWGMAIRAALR